MSEASRPDRAAALVETFARLAGALTVDRDPVDMLDGLACDCVSLFAVDAAGLLFGDRRGTFHVVASSDERPGLVDLLEMQVEHGPGADCLRTGAPTSAPDLEDHETGRRWPVFAARAVAEGFRATHTVPMRLPTRTVGALNLLGAEAGHLPADDLRAAQALADTATVGLLGERTAGSGAAVLDRLRTILAGRMAVEQAKGILAERGDLDVADAFVRLRDHARRTGRRLTDLAGLVVDGTVDAATVVGGDQA